MRYSSLVLFAGFLFVPFLGGCGQPAATNATTGTETEKAEEHDHDHDHPVEEEIEVRSSLEGRWLLNVANKMDAFPVSVLEVSKDGDTYTAKQMSVSPDAPKLQSETVSADAVTLEFSMNGRSMIYNGRLRDDGVVRGIIKPEVGTVQLGIMLPTTLTSISSSTPRPLPKKSRYSEVPEAEKPHEALLEFIKEHPETALAMDAYPRWLAFAKAEKFTAEKIDAVVEDYRKTAAGWGEARATYVPMDVAVVLSGQGYLPEVSSRYLDEFKETLGDDPSPQMATLVETIGMSVTFARNLEFLASDDTSKHAEAIESLNDNVRTNPVNGRAILALATHFKKAGDDDKVIEYLSKLVAIPNLERMVIPEMMAADPSASLPSQQLTELWMKKHGSTSGLDDSIGDVYRETFRSFIPEDKKFKPRAGKDANNKVALVELFTGASCPPCVAADLTAEILTSRFESTEMIVLRYHLHIPGPDPLATRGTHRRFSYYNGKATPTMVLNGRQIQGASGTVTEVPAIFQSVSQMVAGAINEKIDAKFNLSAHRKDDETVSIKVDITDFDDSDGGEYYLRLALVENDVSYKAPNGVRIHDRVVRAMPGGVEGIAIEDGKATFQDDFSIGKLKESLLTELDMIEQYQNVSLPIRPMEMKQLGLVAFIQEDGDRRVIQSHMVDVSTGDEPVKQTPATESPKEEPATEESSTESESPKEEKKAEPKRDDAKPAVDEGDSEKKSGSTEAKKVDEPAAKKESDEKSDQ